MDDQRDAHDTGDVVISGAGPVGLLLAAELACHGLRVIVLERAGQPDTLPKANGIVGHAGVELTRRGLFGGTRFRVVSPRRFPFGPLVLKLGLGPRNPLHILPIPQRSLEELLERRGTEHGAAVYRSHEVISVTQTDDQVTAVVRAGGSTRLVHGRYLVGCDGAHSLVRKQAGISFPGFTSDEIARIACVTIPAQQITHKGDILDIAGVGRVAAMRPNQLAGGRLSIAPAAALDPSAPADLYLISTHEPRGEAQPSETVSSDELRASLRRVGAELPFTEATAIRSTVGNSRQADAYRRGRVFLAGDAAHLFNAGGSALNVGLQDALDLSHRLTEVLCDGSPPEVLDSYQAVRGSAGRHALHQTRAQAALAGNDDTARAYREIVSELLTRRSTARHLARLIEGAPRKAPRSQASDIQS